MILYTYSACFGGKKTDADGLSPHMELMLDLRHLCHPLLLLQPRILDTRKLILVLAVYTTQTTVMAIETEEIIFFHYAGSLFSYRVLWQVYHVILQEIECLSVQVFEVGWSTVL